MDPLGCGLTLESTNARAARRQGVWRMLQAISARETPVDGVSDKDHRGRGLPMYTYKYIYIYKRGRHGGRESGECSRPARRGRPSSGSFEAYLTFITGGETSRGERVIGVYL